MENRGDFFEYDEEYIRKRIAKFNANDIYDPDLLENMADFCMNEEDYDKAAEILAVAVRLYPYHAGLLANYGFALLQQEKENMFDADYKKGYRYIYKAYQLQPNDAEILHKLGYAYILCGDSKTGIDFLHQSIKQDKEYIENYLLLALIYKDDLKYHKAIEYLEQLIEISEDVSSDYVSMLAECLKRTKQFKKRLKTYKAELQQNPYNIKKWYLLALLYDTSGYYLDALYAYNFVITLNEKHTEAHISIANIYIRLEAYNKAIEHLKTAFETDKTHYEVSYSLAECYTYMGAYQKARESYLETTKLKPDYHEAWFGLGVCAEFYQNYDMAVVYFQKAFAIQPHDSDYMLALANTKYRAGYIKDAYQTYKEGIKKFPESVSMWLDFSACLYEQKEFEEAVNTLKKAIQENDDEASLYYRLAAYLYSMIQPQEANKYFLLGLENDFDKHTEVFEVFPQLRFYAPLLQLIQNFENKNTE